MARDPRSGLRQLSPSNIARWRSFRHTIVTCNICGHRGTLLFELPDAAILADLHIGANRETLRCRNCCSKMRDRAMARGLLNVLARHHGILAASIDELTTSMPADIRVLETDANSRIARRLGHLPGVTLSLYNPAYESGATLSKGVLNVDLENMPFVDNSFDVILTSEVMEHVRFVDVAHREIVRCLAPHGRYLFTVPYDESLEHTWQLIDPETDAFLVSPPHMHGDPGMRDEGIKSYRVFGRDIVQTLRRDGLDVTFAWIDSPEVGLFHADLFEAASIATS